MMMSEGFPVEDGTFWVTEVNGDDESEMWVYSTQDGAIEELMNHVEWEGIDLDDLDMEEFFKDYSVQEVDVVAGEYSIQAVSPHKILFARIQSMGE